MITKGVKQLVAEANTEIETVSQDDATKLLDDDGVLFVDRLDEFRIGGFPLGFWIAQQGAMYAFVGV